jgi:hypothetical protein
MISKRSDKAAHPGRRGPHPTLIALLPFVNDRERHELVAEALAVVRSLRAPLTQARILMSMSNHTDAAETRREGGLASAATGKPRGPRLKS